MVNYTDCPSGFTTAFQQHREAWLNTKAITDKYPELRGEMHDLFKQLGSGKDSVAFKQLQKAIWDTWATIEKTMK